MRNLIWRIARSRLCRWTLTVVSALMLTSTVLSWFGSAHGSVEFATKHVWSRYGASFCGGRVWFSATPNASACFGGPPARPEFWAGFDRDRSSPLDWLGVPCSAIAGSNTIWSTGGTEYWFYCSGLIPAAVAGLPAIFLWRRQRRNPADACPICGYLLTGLTSDRCPECGHAAPGDTVKP